MVKVGLSFNKFNLFPINIFKIHKKKHVFTVLALIFAKKKDNFFAVGESLFKSTDNWED